jgi:hypothetical protein
MVEPKPRKDQKCARCGKPKPSKRRAASGSKSAAKGAVRLNQQLWLDALERDPWCSRACCEAWHASREAVAA